VPDPLTSSRSGITTPSRPPSAREFGAAAAASKAQPAGPTTTSNPQHGMQPPTSHNPQPHAGQGKSLPLSDQQQSSNEAHHSSLPGISCQHFAPQPAQQQSLPSNAPQTIPPVGFYSARVAPHVNSDSSAVPSNIPKFDPHAESPSIRKTPGIDHSKTIPVKRGLTGTTIAAAPALQEGITPRTNIPKDFVNPSTDIHRRIGAPGGGMHSRGSTTGSAYRPPTRRGPDSSIAGGAAAPNSGITKRAPLGDISNMQHSTTDTFDRSDAKRQRITGPENSVEGNHSASVR
jgi:DNA repair and recombination protein RAD52